MDPRAGDARIEDAYFREIWPVSDAEADMWCSERAGWHLDELEYQNRRAANHRRTCSFPSQPLINFTSTP